MGRLGIIIQARLSSERFPRKIAAEVLSSSLLTTCVRRTRTIESDLVLVCAPEDEQGDSFWNNYNECEVFFGNHHNLLIRYYEAAKLFNVSVIVRITADNPYFSTRVVEALIEFQTRFSLDYVSAKRDDGAWLPYGLGAEIFTFDALERVKNSENKLHQEHVSEAFLFNKKIRSSILFKPLNFCSARTKNISLTIDYPEQLSMLKEIGFA